MCIRDRHGTAEYAKIHPDQLITIAEMEADARRAIPADRRYDKE